MRKLFSMNKNISLYLLTNLLIHIGFGIGGADFNLYILSMGMQPDFLGVILSLTPFAQVAGGGLGHGQPPRSAGERQK